MRLLAGSIGWLVLLASGHAATIITGYDAQVHNRFDSSSFHAAGFDWSGVGRSSDGRWATLIGDDIFLSANHFKPGTGTTVTFHTDNASAGPTVTRTVTGGTRIGNTDLWLGNLDSAVPGSVSTYAIAGTVSDTISPTENWFDPYVDRLVYTAGLSGTTITTSTTNFVVGRNRIDLADDESAVVSGLGVFDAHGMIFDEVGDPNFDAIGEARLQGGDSGGPSFISVNGELVLIGIHSYITTVKVPATLGDLAQVADSVSVAASLNPFNPANAGNERFISFDVFVPNYVDDLETIVGPVIAISPIPEPGFIATVVVALAVTGFARRRRS